MAKIYFKGFSGDPHEISPETAMLWLSWHEIVEPMEKHDQRNLDRAVKEVERNCPDWEMRVLKRFLELTEADLVI